jgi:hypothetical protein
MTLKEYEEDLASVQNEITGEKMLTEIICIDLHCWRYIIKDLDGFDGICISDEKLIEMDTKKKDDDITLLHEMTHAYEGMMPETYRQYVAVRLFQKLQYKIPNLISLISADLHTVSHVAFHSPLFTLKALDLDIRLGLPLGTVYSYEKKDFYLNITE